jgi:hypothetical protein
MIEDEERKVKVTGSTKRLFTTARENNVAVVHCLMDTASDPPTTSKGVEKWHSMIKPLLSANPEMATA